MAHQFRLAALAVAVFASQSAAVRLSDRTAELAVEGAKPPKDAVELGLVAAEGHVAAKEKETASALAAATASVETAQNAMTEAMMHNDLTASKMAYEQFEKAIAAKKAAEEAAIAAKQLHEMVKTHNAIVERFFDAVANFLETQRKLTESRQMKDAEHLKNVKDAARDRLHKHNRDEVFGAAALQKQFEDIRASGLAIKAKDDALGRPGVHAAVKDGIAAVHKWANGEVTKVCEKYMHATDESIVNVREGLRQDGKVDCGHLIKALAEHFPIKIEGDQ